LSILAHAAGPFLHILPGKYICILKKSQKESKAVRAHLRKQVLALRGSMGPSERAAKSAAAYKLLLQLEEFQRADNLFCYVSYQSELETLTIIKERLARGGKVSVPLTIPGRGLEAYEISDPVQDLAPGYCSIPEPLAARTKKSDPGTIDVVLLPGSVFDLKGGRLGYGGGYYDRFLAQKAPKALRVGLAFELQVVDHVPVLDHDQTLNYLVTEERIIRI
jgi:5-formyltetrahydrofolate cyclo-ligase